MPLLLGTAPNQVPTNADLGTMAFEDANSVNIQGGLVQNATVSNVTLLSPANVTAYQLVANSYPSTPPSLMLDFANSKTLDPRITFTRASTATYYDGVTNAVAEQNLILYSQDLSNAAWIKTSSTVTANSVVAPDGTTTANTLTASSTATTVCVGQGIQNIVGQTISVYAKAGTSSFLGVQVYNSASWAYFNLSTGAVASSSGCTASIVSVGNSWYRCIIANTINGALNVLIAGKDADPGVAPYGNGNMTSGNTLYLWGFQIETRSAVTAYNVTTTAAITNYIPVLQTAASGVARLDYNPMTGESLGLLIEESRVNLLTYSSNSQGWATNSNTTPALANAQGIAPDGTNTAINIPYGATGFAQNNITVPADTNTYTYSFYAKSITGVGVIGAVTMGLAGGSTFSGTIFNFSTQVTGSGWTATNVGNGWYRISRSFVNTNVTTFVNRLDTTSTTATSVLFWGAQLEAGAFATSYIPTVASQVTRAADAASMTGTNFSSWYNVGQGTVYGEARTTYTQDGGGVGILSIRSTSDNAWGIGINPNLSGSASSVRTNAVTQAIFYATQTSGVYHKVSLSAANNNITYTNDGLAIQSVLAGVTPIVDTLYIGQNRAGIVGSLNIKRITYYPVALTSTQLVALTT